MSCTEYLVCGRMCEKKNIEKYILHRNVSSTKSNPIVQYRFLNGGHRGRIKHIEDTPNCGDCLAACTKK